ncbi:MAG: hypothetical protein C0467_30725 [Planctomycetaceae bacterium]|nr:hypothetical protein [Planctomycetaceae bacterium]
MQIGHRKQRWKVESGTKPGTPKWILIATGVVSLVGGMLLAVAKYYEIRKARAEADVAERLAKTDVHKFTGPDKAPIINTPKQSEHRVTKIAPKAGDEVQFPIPGGLKMTFCWIPAGTAQLGSPKAERDAAMRAGAKPEWVAEEGEEKRGRFTTKGFWLGKYSLTQAEWESLTGNNPSYFKPGGAGASKVKGLDTSRFPVESVNWNDVPRFLEKLNAVCDVERVFGIVGTFALPHEDAWEYACRGGLGNQRAFYWGNELNGTQANIIGSAPFGTAVKGPILGCPTPVGTYETRVPHPWGLCDMHGNVWNWCDNLDEKTNYRKTRGGSWNDVGLFCRAAMRCEHTPGSLGYIIGLRICLSPR